MNTFDRNKNYPLLTQQKNRDYNPKKNISVKKSKFSKFNAEIAKRSFFL